MPLPQAPSFIERALQEPPPTNALSVATLMLLSIRVMVHEHFTLSPKEEALQEVLLNALPELQGVRIEQLDEALAQVTGGYLKRSHIQDAELATAEERLGLFMDILQELRGLPTEALRKKCFLIAAEMAFVNGSTSPTKDRLLEHIYKTLGIAPDTARKILRVLSIKYGR